MIATAPRTGSSLLAEGLAATRRAGNPDEFFDQLPRNEQIWAHRYNAPDGDGYLDQIVQASRTPNGVFGFKLHWHQMPALHRRLVQAMPPAVLPDTRPTLELIRRRFPGIRFLWLSRRNKVAQAISYYRATKSHVWRVWNDGRQPTFERAPMPEYDRDEIENYVLISERMEAGWNKFLHENQIPALVLIYEDFVESYERTIHGVLEFLDIPRNDLVLPAPKLQRIADEESLEWERRYRARPPKPSAAVAKPPEPPRSLSLIAYDVGSDLKTTLKRGMPGRSWMDASPNRFAYRCLPMVIANQWGWVIQTQHRVRAVWDGSASASGLVVTTSEGAPTIAASSHFGGGILTFHIGFLIRTPPGYNLHVRGPVNLPKDGISALEGVIESDWADSTFTMNWKMTRTNHPVVFEPGEPIAMISPVKRGELEQFEPEIRMLSEDPDLSQGYAAWSASRGKFNADLRAKDPEARKQGWQKDYIRGRSVLGESAPEHQTSIPIKDFTDRR